MYSTLYLIPSAPQPLEQTPSDCQDANNCCSVCVIARSCLVTYKIVTEHILRISPCYGSASTTSLASVLKQSTWSGGLNHSKGNLDNNILTIVSVQPLGRGRPLSYVAGLSSTEMWELFLDTGLGVLHVKKIIIAISSPPTSRYSSVRQNWRPSM